MSLSRRTLLYAAAATVATPALRRLSFAQTNPELLVWKNGILNRYYQPETLKSDLARSVFVFPDKYV